MVLARHLRTNKEYALKILDKSFVLRHKLTDSVRLERKLLDELEYEGIVHLDFTFQDEQSLYLGLQCCPNGADLPAESLPAISSSVRSSRQRLTRFKHEGLLRLAGELFDQITRREKVSESDTRFYAAEIVLMLEHLRTRQV